MAAHEGKPLRVAVVGGSGPSAERSFTPGEPSGPFSVGRQGEWAIEGRGVGALDGFFYFDGRELFVCSRDLGSPLMLDGRAIGTTWEPVPLGAILVVGRTRLVVEDPTPAPDSSSTILTDLEAMRAPPVPVAAPVARAVASAPAVSNASAPTAPRPSAHRGAAAVPGVAPTKTSVGMFSSDDEHTRIGEVMSHAEDSDDAPTAFLSSSVRDAVRGGLAREPTRASARPPSRPASSAPPQATASIEPAPTHVLRVDARAGSTPPPVGAGALHDNPFFHGDDTAGGVPLEAQSLPRLSGALPLYGASLAPRGPLTEPPGAEEAGASWKGAIAHAWSEASPVRKVTVALIPAALAAFGFVMFVPAPAPPGPRAPKPAESTSTSHAAPSPAEPEPVTPRLVGASTGLSQAADGGLTLERRAADAVHAHRMDEAAALYKELSAGEPRNGAFSTASEVLARAANAAR